MQKTLVAFNIKNDEISLFKKKAQENGVDAFLYTEKLTLENADKINSPYISISYESKIDEPLMQVLKEKGVQLIKTRTIGINHIDLDAAKSLNIEVQNTQYVTDGIAEHIIMITLMAMRQINKVLENNKNNNYALLPERAVGLYGKTIGIIGTGRIALELVKRLLGFECEIIAYDLYENDEIKKMGTKYVSLDELYAKSDVIIPLVPLTNNTTHMINKDAIAKMKDGVYIVNCSRGGVIKSDDLNKALEVKKVAYAAVDVFEGDENIFYHDLSEGGLNNAQFEKFRTLPNVIITPHIAYYSKRVLDDIIKQTFSSLNTL